MIASSKTYRQIPGEGHKVVLFSVKAGNDDANPWPGSVLALPNAENACSPTTNIEGYLSMFLTLNTTLQLGYICRKTPKLIVIFNNTAYKLPFSGQRSVITAQHQVSFLSLHPKAIPQLNQDRSVGIPQVILSYIRWHWSLLSWASPLALCHCSV